jgi:hypothetical protein
MTLQRWTGENGSLVIKQEVDITVKTGNPHSVPVVSNAAFTIPFYHLFMRQPNRWTWPRERDVQLTEADLTILAEKTWKLRLGSSRKSILKQPAAAFSWLVAILATLLAILATPFLATQVKPFLWLVALLVILLAILVTLLSKFLQ